MRPSLEARLILEIKSGLEARSRQVRRGKVHPGDEVRSKQEVRSGLEVR